MLCAVLTVRFYVNGAAQTLPASLNRHGDHSCIIGRFEMTGNFVFLGLCAGLLLLSGRNGRVIFRSWDGKQGTANQ